MVKLCAWISISDLIPVQQTISEKFLDTIVGKKKIFQNHRPRYVFQSLKESGVNGIELLIPLLSTDQNICEARKILDGYEMPVLSIHQSLNFLKPITLEEIERLCIIANLFSAKYITLHSGALHKRLFSPIFIDTLKHFQKIYNITFGIENMPKSVFAIGKKFTYSSSKFTTLMSNIGLSMTFDTTHSAQAGDDIISSYKNNKERIVNIHLSDFKRHWLNSRLLLQNYTHLPLMQGSLPMYAFLSELKRSNYRGLITAEVDGNLEELIQSAQIIRYYME